MPSPAPDPRTQAAIALSREKWKKLEGYLLRLPLLTKVVMLLIAVFHFLATFGVPVEDYFALDPAKMNLGQTLVTFPGFLYLGIEMFILKGNTVVAGASALVFTLMAAEAIKTHAFHPYYNIAGWEVPSWTTPVFWVIVAAFLIPASSLIGHLCGLVIGYAYASRYLRLLEPSEWILAKIETKLGFLFRRIPYYISLENRTEMNYWEFLPMTNSMRSTRGGASVPAASSAAPAAFAAAGPGVRLGS
ncbi:putative rhomboid protease [Maublancomyces gigas]|uniref:Rhomboid protease n=1 Tax=Discina gigas TaxID=1032678 RepID=A0ABR3GF80_9PEZI